MSFKSLLLASILAVGGGTANASAGATTLDLSKLLAATQADLTAAYNDANAHNDAIAAQCYKGVGVYLAQSVGGNPSISVNIVGVASAFQTARDGVKIAETVQATAGLPQPIIIACGPLALDVQNDLGKAGLGTFNLVLAGKPLF